MDVLQTALADVRIVKPRRFGDHRGFFSETFNAKAFVEAGLPTDYVQDNHSLSATKGTIRGLHFQLPPLAQGKLVRVVKGAILDVAVDIRRQSATFGQSVAIVVSAAEWNQLFIPIGFAHGFCTLEADTEVIYKVTDFYSVEHEHGILWNDPDLGIDWPIAADLAVLSEKDKVLPRLKDLPAYF